MKEISLSSIIEIAVKSEDLGVRVYSDLAKKYSKNPDIREVFEILAKDEVEHKRQFNDLLKSASNIHFTPTEIDKEYLKGVDPSRKFEEFENSTNLELKNVMKAAYEFEKDSVLFYLGIRDVIGKNDVINKIINMEKAHMTKLLKYSISDSQFRGMSDDWD